MCFCHFFFLYSWYLRQVVKILTPISNLSEHTMYLHIKIQKKKTEGVILQFISFDQAHFCFKNRLRVYCQLTFVKFRCNFIHLRMDMMSLYILYDQAGKCGWCCGWFVVKYFHLKGGSYQDHNIKVYFCIFCYIKKKIRVPCFKISLMWTTKNMVKVHNRIGGCLE